MLTTSRFVISATVNSIIAVGIVSEILSDGSLGIDLINVDAKVKGVSKSLG
jgi:hypothetical protein